MQCKDRQLLGNQLIVAHEALTKIASRCDFRHETPLRCNTCWEAATEDEGRHDANNCDSFLAIRALSVIKYMKVRAAKVESASPGTGWVCGGCGREWSAMLGDSEAPETCPDFR